MLAQSDGLNPGDAPFSAAQIERLTDLMTRWRSARDTGTPFTPAEQTELTALVEIELKASVWHAAALLQSGTESRNCS